MEIDPIDRGLLDRLSGMEIEPIRSGPARSTVGSITNSTRSLFYLTTTMNSPAPNITGAVSTMSPFTEYFIHHQTMNSPAPNIPCAIREMSRAASHRAVFVTIVVVVAIVTRCAVAIIIARRAISIDLVFVVVRRHR